MRAWVAIIGAILWVSARAAHASLVYTPPNFQPSSASVLVVIHGCLQNAEMMALGTEFNRVADEKNWVVLYPQVPAGSNAINCWSWYEPENQGPDSGQLRLIYDEIESLKRRLGLKSPAQYLAGISSGGATVSGLIACFPDAFRAAAIHSGPSYGLADSLASADRVLREGPSTVPSKAPCRPSNYQGRVLVIHGDHDKVVNPLHAERIVSDFVASDPKRGEILRVKDLAHAWSGFKPKMKTEIPFFSPKGPSATEAMTEFFLRP